MNGCALFRDQWQEIGLSNGDKIRFRDRTRGMLMTGGIAAFLAAVGGTSLVCYWLMNRAENRRARRQSASGDGGDSGGGFTAGYRGDGWNVFSWFGGSSSGSDNASSDTSGASGDWSGSDSGGSSGDSGGGGGDGGGGGGD